MFLNILQFIQELSALKMNKLQLFEQKSSSSF